MEVASKYKRVSYSSDGNDDLRDARPEGLSGSGCNARVNILRQPGGGGRRSRHRGRGGPFAGIKLGESHCAVVEATLLDHLGIGQASFSGSEKLCTVVGRYMPLCIAATVGTSSCCCDGCC